MNRPLWLDLLYLVGFSAPLTLLATVFAVALSAWLKLPG
jgi:hypothetical protein